MSEAMKMRSMGSRFHLLTSVSAIALISSICNTVPAMADDSSAEPALWMEMGVYGDSIHDSVKELALPVGSLASGITGPLASGLNLSRSYGNNGKISFQPHDTDLVFSASVTYGRSRRSGAVNQVDPNPATSFVSYQFTYPFFPQSNKRSTNHLPVPKLGADVNDSESHLVIDFQAGKDVGLGLFGHGSVSTLGAGVRFAHFSQLRQTDNFLETNGIHFQSSTFKTTFWPGYGTNRRAIWDTIGASGSDSREFMGVGPSIFWNASVPLAGDEKRGGEFLFDWGFNASMLFGKQKDKVEHRSSSSYNCVGRGCKNAHVQYAPQSSGARISKSVTVPNVGGFAGVSYRAGELKANFGYRADYFFRAIDARLAGGKAITRGFQGPYASVSIAVGD